MKIRILILTDRCVYWLNSIKKCLKPAGFFGKCNDEYFMENELFKIEIKSELGEARGRRYYAAVIDKYIPDSIIQEIVFPMVKKIGYTDYYYKEKVGLKDNEKEKGGMTVKEFIETIAVGDVTIANRYEGEIVTWRGNGKDSFELGDVLTKEISDKKVLGVCSKDNGLIVLTDYKEEDK